MLSHILRAFIFIALVSLAFGAEPGDRNEELQQPGLANWHWEIPDLSNIVPHSAMQSDANIIVTEEDHSTTEDAKPEEADMKSESDEIQTTQSASEAFEDFTAAEMEDELNKSLKLKLKIETSKSEESESEEPELKMYKLQNKIKKLQAQLKRLKQKSKGVHESAERGSLGATKSGFASGQLEMLNCEEAPAELQQECNEMKAKEMKRMKKEALQALFAQLSVATHLQKSLDDYMQQIQQKTLVQTNLNRPRLARRLQAINTVAEQVHVKLSQKIQQLVNAIQSLKSEKFQSKFGAHGRFGGVRYGSSHLGSGSLGGSTGFMGTPSAPQSGGFQSSPVNAPSNRLEGGVQNPMYQREQTSSIQESSMKDSD